MCSCIESTMASENEKSVSTMHSRRACSGFSLLEILVTIAIVGILASSALPSFAAFIDKEKISALTQEFSSSLVIARSAAIKSGTHVVFCASGTDGSCSSDWSAGWYAFQDDDKNGTQGSDESTILFYRSTSDNVQVSVTNDDAAITAVRFDYRGTPDTLLEAQFSRNEASSTVEVTPFGKARISE